MARDLSPLFWFVLLALIILTVAAYITWRKAWNRLHRQELAEITQLHNTPVPTTWASADALLPRDSPSVVVTALRHALQTGEVRTDMSECYDWIHLPRYLAGVFVFIGLLGTILGIAVSVTSLGAAVSNSSGASDQLGEISQHIFSLLSGMKYAFYCTIGGLTATLIISALNASYLSRCRQAETQTEALAYRIFLPMHAVGPDRSESQGPTMPEMLDMLRASVDILTQTANRFSAEIVPAAQTFHQTTLKMPEMLIALRYSADELSNSTKNFSDSILPISKTLQQTVAVTAELSETLMSTGSTLRENLDASAKRSEEIRKTMEFAGEGFRETLENLSATASGLEGAATQYASDRSGLTSAVKDAALEMSGSVKTLQENLSASTRRQQEQLGELIAGSTSDHAKLGQLLRQFEMTLADVTAVAEQSTLRQDVQHLIEHIHLLQQETSAASPLREMAAIRADVTLLSRQILGVGTQLGTVGAKLTEVDNRTERLDAGVSHLAEQVTLIHNQVRSLEEEQSAPVSKRFPRVFHKGYWV